MAKQTLSRYLQNSKACFRVYRIENEAGVLGKHNFSAMEAEAIQLKPGYKWVQVNLSGVIYAEES